jgi:hypothetical protein
MGRFCFADAGGRRRARAASALGRKTLNEIENMAIPVFEC